jgi:transposase
VSATWREVIEDAFAGVDRAVERRRRVLTAALDAGMSLRTVADASPVSFNTIYRMVGKRGMGSRGRELLDSTAPAPSEEER